jgi:hypothetical protein
MKKTVSIALSCIAALALFGTTANAANLIVNGGFEEPNLSSGWSYFNSASVPGWNGDNIEIWHSESMLGAGQGYGGTQHAELNSHPNQTSPFTINQAFATEVGQTYEISFGYRARTGNSDSSNESFLVGIVNDVNDIGGSEVFKSLVDDHVVGKWYTFTGTFVASSTQSIIYFQSLTSGTLGNFIDEVSVSAVPVPAAVWLFGSALVGLVTFGSRRSR